MELLNISGGLHLSPATPLEPQDTLSEGSHAEHEGSEGEWNKSSLSCPIDVRSLDFSSYEYPYRKEIFKSIGTEEIIKILFYVFIFLISLVGNVLVILVVYYNAHMRTSTNQYLVNLAAADLLVTICSIWVHIVRHLSHPHYVLPGVICKMEGFIIASTLTASVLTLTVISVGRFVAVMFPLHARTSASHANRVIFVIWLLATLMASPTILFRKIYDIQWLDFTLWHCDEFWPTEGRFDSNLKQCLITYDGKKYFYTIFTVSLYFIPITVMFFSYSLVIWRLWVTQLPGEHSQPARITVTRSKKKVVKMVTFVFLAFVFCWTPLQSCILYSNFLHGGEELPEWFPKLEYAAYFVAHTNSALNPVLYCSFNAGFRQGLSSLLHCKKSSRGRLHHRRLNWKGTTGGSRDTTFGGVSGTADQAVMVEFTSIRKSRNKFGERSSMRENLGSTRRSIPTSPATQMSKMSSRRQSYMSYTTSPSSQRNAKVNNVEVAPETRKSSLGMMEIKVNISGNSTLDGACDCCGVRPGAQCSPHSTNQKTRLEVTNCDSPNERDML